MRGLDAQYNAKRLTTPKGDSAYDTYAEILIMDPGNQRAIDGIKELKQRYIQWADYAAKQGDTEHAGYLYKKALSIEPDDKKLESFIDRFVKRQNVQSASTPVVTPTTEPTTTNSPQEQSIGTINDLFDAITVGDINKVKSLLQDKSLVNARQNSTGFTPLINASIHGRTPIIKSLLDKNASIDLSDKLGNTALMWAIEKEWFDASSYLIQQGASIEATNQAGGTALHYAAWDGNMSMAQLLLSKGADINKKNNNGASPLIQAVINGHADIVKTLIHNNAETDLTNNNGWTALMYAARAGDKEITKSLLINHANANLENNNGMKAVDIANTHGHEEIVAMLRESIAKNTQ